MIEYRNIGAGVGRHYGITEVVSVSNDGSGPWRVKVKGTYGRSITICFPSKAEAIGMGNMLSKLINTPKSRKKKRA